MKIILTILLIIAIFIGSKKLVCPPDRKVAEVSLPLAKAIVEHIEANGVPEYLNDIEGLPYELKGCKKTKHTENRSVDFIEKCFFHKNDKGYLLKFEYVEYEKSEEPLVIYLDIKEYRTKCRYVLRYSQERKKWDREHYPHPNMWKENKAWICNPKLFRITD